MKLIAKLIWLILLIINYKQDYLAKKTSKQA